jgi:hypothetical protein
MVKCYHIYEKESGRELPGHYLAENEERAIDEALSTLSQEGKEYLRWKYEARPVYSIQLGMDFPIYELENFQNWLEEKGHQASIGNTTGTFIDGYWTSVNTEANYVMNELWDEYCKSYPKTTGYDKALEDKLSPKEPTRSLQA